MHCRRTGCSTQWARRCKAEERETKKVLHTRLASICRRPDGRCPLARNRWKWLAEKLHQRLEMRVWLDLTRSRRHLAKGTNVVQGLSAERVHRATPAHNQRVRLCTEGGGEGGLREGVTHLQKECWQGSVQGSSKRQRQIEHASSLPSASQRADHSFATFVHPLSSPLLASDAPVLLFWASLPPLHSLSICCDMKSTATRFWHMGQSAKRDSDPEELGASAPCVEGGGIAVASRWAPAAGSARAAAPALAGPAPAASAPESAGAVSSEAIPQRSRWSSSMLTATERPQHGHSAKREPPLLRAAAADSLLRVRCPPCCSAVAAAWLRAEGAAPPVFALQNADQC